MIERDRSHEPGRIMRGEVSQPPFPACESDSGCDAPPIVDDESMRQGMPSTRGTAELSILSTLAQSIGRVPEVRARRYRSPDGHPRRGCVVGRDRPGLHGQTERLQLFDVIGRGGMGVVLRGHDTDLGRDLAVKVLREPFRDQPEMVRRFIEEAQIGGQLQHPGIVPVYELGSLADRRPYIAMRLVEGRTLGRAAGRARRPGRRPAAAPGDLRVGLPDDGLCARPGRDPPRPEAVEHHGGAASARCR